MKKEYIISKEKTSNITLGEKMDATNARVLKDFEDKENFSIKDPEMSLNYVKVDSPDSDDYF